MGKALPGAEAVCHHGDSDFNWYLSSGAASLPPPKWETALHTHGVGPGRVFSLRAEQGQSQLWNTLCAWLAWLPHHPVLPVTDQCSARSPLMPCGTLPRILLWGRALGMPWPTASSTQPPHLRALRTWSGLQCPPCSYPGGVVQSRVKPVRNGGLHYSWLNPWRHSRKREDSRGKGEGMLSQISKFPLCNFRLPLEFLKFDPTFGVTDNGRLPSGASDKELACQCRKYKRHKSTSRTGRSPGEGHGNPFQYSCLENPMDRGALWTTVYRVEKSRTRLKWLSMCTCVGEWHASLNHILSNHFQYFFRDFLLFF